MITAEPYTILFDLDETLVHCSLTAPLNEGAKVSLGSGRNPPQVVLLNEASLFIRPHAREILSDLSKDFEVLVFTSSNKEYAREVVKKLDPGRKNITFLLHRDHCNIRSNMAIKDLRVIKNRELSKMLIVDNCVGSFGTQLANGIPILAFEGDKNDRELLHLSKYLREVFSSEDPVETNMDTFGLSNLRFCKGARQYLDGLAEEHSSTFN